MNICTIIATNYLAHARVLAGSIHEHHPNANVWVLVLDDKERTFDFSHEAFYVLHPSDLDLEPAEFDRMATIYDVMELATAVKPSLLRTLLKKVDAIAYFDPDIEAFANLDDLLDLARLHGIVLTPHNLSPIPRDGMTPVEAHVLQSGIYNLGFIAVSRSAAPFLAWWSERLRRDCVVDLARQLFVDQRWIDFVPGMFDHRVVRDPGCNVAYWNLPQRHLTWTGTGYEVDGYPLRFFHYSGYSPKRPHVLSKHQGEHPRVTLADYPDVARICRHYRHQLEGAGFETSAADAYGLGITPSDVTLDRRIRRLYRDVLMEIESTGGDPSTLPDPFAPEGDRALLEWLRTPRADSPRVSLYLKTLHEERDDLKAAYPDLLRADADRFLEWAKCEAREGRLPSALASAQLGHRELGRKVGTMIERWPRPPVPEEAMGINVAGYFFAESGVGQHGRGMVSSVRAAGLPHSTVPYRRTTTRQEGEFDPGRIEGAAYATNLICVNADELPNFIADMGSGLVEHRYNIGYWAWEVDVFPEWLHDRAALVDEVWANSAFTATNIGRAISKPVLACPPVVIPPTPPAATRHELNLSEDFLFLFCFDFDSIFDRKNPLGLVDAFAEAFPPDAGAQLVIKTVNGDTHPERLGRLREAASPHRHIEIRDGYVTAEIQHALMASCDVYVSLHRAEGFGLTLAEAMALGTPVIGTGYSGNLDFMTDANSFLVPWSWVTIPPGCDPYPVGTGWAEPDTEGAARIMRHVFEHPTEAAARAARAVEDIRLRHSPSARGEFIRWRLEAIHASRPELFESHRAHYPELSVLAG